MPDIGRARFDEHTTTGGRTRMMMMMITEFHKKLVIQAKLSSSTDPGSEPEPPMTSSLSPSADDIDLVKSQFHEVLLMLENRDFVLYSQPVGIIHILR